MNSTGPSRFKKLFGREPEGQEFPARFIYLNDDDDEAVVADGSVTRYDARAGHATQSEHRLYFPTMAVSECAARATCW